MNFFRGKENFFLWLCVILVLAYNFFYVSFTYAEEIEEVGATSPALETTPIDIAPENEIPPVAEDIGQGTETIADPPSQPSEFIVSSAPDDVDLPINSDVEVGFEDAELVPVLSEPVLPVVPDVVQDIAVLPQPIATTSATTTLYSEAEIANAAFFEMSTLPTFIFNQGSTTKEGFFAAIQGTISDTVTQVADAAETIVDMVSDAAQTVIEFMQPTVETLFSLIIDIAPEEVTEDSSPALAEIPQELPAEVSVDVGTLESVSTIEQSEADPAIQNLSDSDVEHAVDQIETEHEEVDQTTVQTNSDEVVDIEVLHDEPDTVETTATSSSNATTSASTPPAPQASTTVYVDGVLVPHTVVGIDEDTYAVTLQALVDPGPHMLRFQTDTAERMVVHERLFFVGGFVTQIQPLDQGKTLYFIRTREGGTEAWLKEHALGSAIGFLKLADNTTMLLDSPFEYVEGKVIWASAEGGAFVGFDTNARTMFSQTREIRGDTQLQLEQETYDVSLEPDDISFVIESDPIVEK